MSTIGTAIWHVIIGVFVLFVIWYVFDSVNDKNTAIILAAIGTVYTQTIGLARRQRFFALTVLYLFGRLWARIKNESYDEDAATRTIKVIVRLGNLELCFVALIEILCLYRLFTALWGRGWDVLAIPLRSMIANLLPLLNHALQ